MASGSGRTRGDIRIEESVNGHREESNAVAVAAAEPPPLAPPSDGLQEWAHGPPGSRGRDPSASAAATKRKGKNVSLAPSPTSSEGIISVSGAGESSHAEMLVDLSGGGRSNVSWKNPLVEGIMEVPKVTRHIDLKEVFDDVLLERQWAMAEEMEMQQWQQGKPSIIWPEKIQIHKKSLWNKLKGGIENMFSERIERQMHDCSPDSTEMVPHVNQQTIPMTGIIEHYDHIEMAAGHGVIFHSNALDLRRAYSEFRPVHGDGECFYMSFTFSYLEQILDRQDTHAEHRLLAAIRGVARQQVHLGWTSKFSWRYKWGRPPLGSGISVSVSSTVCSYRKQKLLNFFSGYGRTNDIFAFLRLVAPIWICSHSEEFEPLVPDLHEDYTLRDWCCREVIQCKVFTDHVQMTALATALGVPLRVEYLLQGAGQDLYTGQEDTQDDTPRSTCWPRRRRPRHQVPHGHVVPCVTVLYTNAHYDIIYPHCRDVPSVDGRCRQQIAQVQRLTIASSSQQIAGDR